MLGKPNIVLISADSLRADHLSCYGYPLSTSPTIDAMACQGVLCENVFAPVIPTQPSHTTIFTGQHPLTHGVVAHGGKANLARDTPVLAELLLEDGYTTCAVDTLFRERTWFGRGFEHVIDPSPHHFFNASVTQEELTGRAIRWLKSMAEAPFFLFIHYWDVHYPYIPPERMRGLFYEGGSPVDPANRALDEWWEHPIGAMARETWLRTEQGLITSPDYVRALYDRSIRYLDEGIAALQDALERMGMADNTLTMLVADHGESMTEHRIYFDHYGLYDATLRVPLIARWPAGELKTGTRLTPFRQLSDVTPTLLEAAGALPPGGMDGASFLGQLRGLEEPAGYARVLSLESTWQAKYCLRTARYKYITAREPDLLGNPDRELYDLEADPREVHNIAAGEPRLAAQLDAELERWIAERLESNGRSRDPVREEGAVGVSIWQGHQACMA